MITMQYATLTDPSSFTLKKTYKFPTKNTMKKIQYVSNIKELTTQRFEPMSI